MQTKAKSNSVITHEVAADRSAVTWKVRGAGEFTLRVGDVSEGVKERAMVHGLIQRVSDAGAMSRDTKTGLPPAPQVRMEAMKRIADHYGSGATEWAIPREAGSGGARGLDEVILAAVVEVTGKTRAEVRELVEAGSAKAGVTARVYLEALGGSGKIKPVVDRIRGEAAPVIDVDAELDALMGLEADEGEEPDEGAAGQEEDSPEGVEGSRA